MEKQASRTAFGPMVQVALEQFQPEGQRLLRDVLAISFLPSSFHPLLKIFRFRALYRLLFAIMERKAPGVRGGILCRKRYLDESLLAAWPAGITQVVNLGAGLDTRLYRLAIPAAVRGFELDMPENIAYKRSKVERLFGRVPDHIALVPIDFDRQEVGAVLQAQGYRPDRPAFFIWEGVTQYISENAVRKVFAFLAQAAGGSRLAFTYIRKDFITGDRLYGMQVMYQATVAKQFWVFGLYPEQVSGFLGEYGWKELEQIGSQEYQTRYLQSLGRVLPVMEIERMVYAEKQS